MYYSLTASMLHHRQRALWLLVFTQVRSLSSCWLVDDDDFFCTICLSFTCLASCHILIWLNIKYLHGRWMYDSDAKLIHRALDCSFQRWLNDTCTQTGSSCFHEPGLNVAPGSERSCENWTWKNGLYTVCQSCVPVSCVFPSLMCPYMDFPVPVLV